MIQEYGNRICKGKSQDQKLELLLDDLKSYGCELILKEKMLWKGNSRPQLEKMMGQLPKADIVVVWKLDRLGLSLDQIKRVNFLSISAVHF